MSEHVTPPAPRDARAGAPVALHVVSGTRTIPDVRRACRFAARGDWGRHPVHEPDEAEPRARRGNISDVLSAIIDAAEPPLIVNKLEGDAVFFYARTTEATMAAVGHDALRQANRFIAVFDRRKAEMLRNVVCECDGCKAIVVLTIKAVLHLGEVKVRKIHKFTELSGVSVIEAHRLTKNSVPVKEYLLCSRLFETVAGCLNGKVDTALIEQCEGIGDFDVVYDLPDRRAAADDAGTDRWRQLRFMARMSTFLVQRRLGLKKQRFHNLRT